MFSDWLESGHRECLGKILLIVRHGETDWTRERRMTSFTDVALNEVGLQQAQALGRYFSNLPIESILSSPMTRAIITSELIAKAQRSRPPLRVCDWLSEVNFGKFEGLPDDTPDEEFQAWRRIDFSVDVPGVETAKKAYERSERLLKTEWTGVRLAVTHGYLSRIIIAAGVLGMKLKSYRKLRLDPCSSAIVSWELECPRLTAINVKPYEESVATHKRRK